MIPQNEFILDIAFHPGETLAEKLEEINMGLKNLLFGQVNPKKRLMLYSKEKAPLLLIWLFCLKMFYKFLHDFG